MQQIVVSRATGSTGKMLQAEGRRFWPVEGWINRPSVLSAIGVRVSSRKKIAYLL
jgi:hypothetical protein